MMNKLFAFIFWGIITLGFFGPKLSSLFSNVETLVHDAPEESMTLLQSVNPADLKSTRERAHYALLMTQVLDKNYINVDSDSLIRQAVNYYEGTKDHNHRMLAFYYEGIVLLNAGDYTQSAIYFEKAIKEAVILEDYFYLGLSNRALAQIMNETNNNTQALVYDKIAIKNFNISEKRMYELYQWLAFAINCANDRQYDKAISVADSLIPIIDSQILQGRFELVKAEALVESVQNDYSVPINIYRSVDKDLFYLTDFCYLALALEKTGQRDSSDRYLQMAFSLSNDNIDSTVVQIFQARIENNRKHFEKSYNLLSEAVEVQDSLTRDLLGQSVSVAQKEFFNKEAQYQEIKAKNARITTCLISATLIFVFLLGLLWMSLQKKEKDALLKEQLALLALEKQNTTRFFSKTAHLIGTLFSERLGRINELAQKYMSAETSEDKDRIFKEYKHKYSSLLSDKEVMKSLESDLNKYCDGIMAKLRAEIPAIKDRQINMISLYFSGLPTIVVQVISCKPSIKAVEMERSRFRKIIKDSGAEHSHLFLKMLE